MKNYDVYFEVYGKKLKKTILAESEQLAKEQLIAAIEFHKIELKPKDEFNEIVDFMDGMMSFLNTVKK